MIHIGFFQLDPTWRLFSRLAGELSARHPNLEFSGVIPNATSRQAIAAADPGGIQNVDLCAFISEGWDEWDTSGENMRRLEEKYGDPHFWYHIYADRVAPMLPVEDLKRILVGTVRFWEFYLERFRPDVFICAGVAHLPTYLGHRVFRHHGVPFRTLGASKLKGRFYLGSEAITQQLDGLSEAYDCIRRSGLPFDLREAAAAYVHDFRRRPEGPFARAMGVRMQQPSLLKRVGSIRRLGSLLRSSIDSAYQQSVRVGASYPVRTILREEVARTLRWREYQWKKLFEGVPEEAEPYAYYALHYQPEATTLVNGQFWTNQVALIENIARSLPITHRLYVKEHQVNLGCRPRGYLESIKAIPNVRLISPFADSHFLTQNADLIFTIAGTVGWEAILYRKPIIVFGNIFYDLYRGVSVVKEPEGLPHAIRNVLHQSPPSEEDLLEFVAAVLECTYPGHVFNANLEPRTLEAENIARIAGTLEAHVLAPLNTLSGTSRASVSS